MKEEIIDYLATEVAKQYGYKKYVEFYLNHDDREVVYTEIEAIANLVK